MGRKTTITREIILDGALRLLIREGYGAVNVKSLAAEIGCSTQPIVWHFENMQKFRQEFFHYCVCHAKKQFTVWNGSLDALLAETARRYVTIARNTPHLFRFVFVDNKEECKSSDVVQTLQLDNTEKIIRLLWEEKGLTETQAAAFLMDYEFYVHGIASYTASGFCHFSEDELLRMVSRTKDALLESHLHRTGSVSAQTQGHVN